MISLVDGDLLSVSCSGHVGLHYGVYMGNGKVMHLPGEWSPVILTDLHSFKKGSPKIGIERPPETNRKDIIKRALECEGKPFWNIGYMKTNNCEHFARWCFSGEARSYQTVSWFTYSVVTIYNWITGMKKSTGTSPHSDSSSRSYNRM